MAEGERQESDEDLDAVVHQRIGTAPRSGGALRGLTAWGARHRLAAILLGSLLVLVLGALVYWIQSQATDLEHAETHAARLEAQLQQVAGALGRSEAGRLAALTDAELDTGPTVALHLAVKSAELAPGPAANSRLYRVLAEQREVVRLYGHDGGLRGCRLLSERDELLSWDDTGLVQLWSLRDSVALRRHVVPSLQDVAWVDARAWIVVSTDEGTLLVFEGAEPAPRTIPVSDEALGALVVAEGGTWAAVASDDGNAYLVDLESGAVKTVFRGHQGRVDDVAIRDDRSEVATIGRDEEVRRWDPVSGDVLAVHATGLKAEVKEVGLPPRRSKIAYAADAKTLLAWSTKGMIHAWRVKDGALVVRYGDERHACTPFCLAASAPRFAFQMELRGRGSEKAAVILHDLEAQRPLARFGGLPRLAPHVLVALDPEGERVAYTVSRRGAVDVREIQKGRSLGRFPGGRLRDVTLDFIDEGRSLMTASRDRTVRVWEVQPTSRRTGLASRSGIVVSPDGRRAVVHGDEGEPIEVKDTASDQQVVALPDATKEDVFLFSDDGSALAYTTPAGDVRAVLPDVPGEGWQVGEVSSVVALAIAGGGARVAVATEEGQILVFTKGDTTPSLRLETTPGARPSFAFSRGARRLAVLGHPAASTTVLDLEGTPGAASMMLPDVTGDAATFDADGRHLIVTSRPGLLRRVELDRAQIVATARFHGSRPGLIPGPDGKLFLHVGYQRVSLRRMADLSEVGELPRMEQLVIGAGFDASGEHVVVTTSDDLIYRWSVDPLAYARQRLPSPLEPNEMVRLGLGTPDEISAAATAYVERQPSAKSYYALGRARVERRRIAEAQEDFEQALGLRPDLMLGEYGLALVEAATLAESLEGTPSWLEARRRGLEHVGAVVASGKVPHEELQADPLLASLRALPEFQALLEGARAQHDDG